MKRQLLLSKFNQVCIVYIRTRFTDIKTTDHVSETTVQSYPCLVFNSTSFVYIHDRVVSIPTHISVHTHIKRSGLRYMYT